MKTSRRWSGLILSGTLACVLVLAGSADIASSKVPETGGTRPRPADAAPSPGSEAKAQKARFDTAEAAFAAERGITIDEAREALTVMSRLVELSPQVERLVPASRLGGVFIDRGVPPKLVVRLTEGAVPPGLRELAPSGLLDIRVDATMSVADRVAVVDEHTPAWQESIPKLDGVYADSSSDRIVLRVASPEAARAVKSVGARAALAALSNTGGPPLQSDGLTLVVEPTSPGSDSNRGGRDLSSCTSAFIGKLSGNPVLLSAGHCTTSPQRWYTFDDTESHAMTLIGTRWNTYADLAWYRPTDGPDMRPRFFGPSTESSEPQKDNFENLEGDWVCHRGKNSGYSCGAIDTVHYKPTYAGACRGATCESRFVLVKSNHLESSAGDSGGPWFRGYGHGTSTLAPLGVHKGNTETGHTAWYSKLGNLPDNLDIWVSPAA